jgi:CHAD domain-containing protein
VAKAADIDVDPYEPFALAAARIVRVRTDEVFAHEDGVLDTVDIERVHDMRVATRRDVKALADALGERRDPDVHIEAMQAFEAAVQAVNRPGVEALVDRLRARQARGNDALAAALEQARECALRDRLHSLSDGAEELIA